MYASRQFSDPTAFFPPICHGHGGDSSTGASMDDKRITSVVTQDEISAHSIPVTERDATEDEDMESKPLEEYEPVVYRGLASGWPALRRWDFDYFASGRVGETTVTVTGREGKKTAMMLKDYISSFRSSHGAEGNAQELEDGRMRKTARNSFKTFRLIPGWAKDWFGRLPAKEDPCFRWIFVGPGGSKTPLHVDPCLTHAWLAQGKTVDVREPNRETFPTFDQAVPYEVVLHPGDVIFVPAGWAHQVECVDDSISLTHNFLPKQNFSAIRACMLANRLGKVVEAQRREVSAEKNGS
ncbi:hypothetical protein GUITHDRAFT_116822 [Guillardia theta CCMP2712]|uniref:JmjC domain-containing protein n=1 Tax=Guillardia theta (strain CCMP2712) TaxID=905079 RepID=L1IMD3_GUITC|nr:hypothetical protein GUITHDRAFT_116822 [Guillardia theta CCMP2712]EKX36955.1 hypothetical protein GUITHDRAFT_116822 [Guillardia theta CCMP2712]|eukprot:XP_005823935.1 hypothetical protein GUITHDRAFT_116822 [Guillardia theta CCMP2712]